MGSFLSYHLDRIAWQKVRALSHDWWSMIHVCPSHKSWWWSSLMAVSRGLIIRLPPVNNWPIATDFMKAPLLAVALLFAASSSTNHISGLLHYSLFQGSVTWSLSLSLSISCCCLLALVCYVVVLLSSEWFLPVIFLNIEISIESSPCVSFSVCERILFRSFSLTGAHYHHPPLLFPFFLFPSSNFRPGPSKDTTSIVFPPCLL